MKTKRIHAVYMIPCLVFLATLPACDTTPPKGLARGPMVQMVNPNGFTVVWYDHDPKATQANARAASGEIYHVRAIKGDADGRRVAVFKSLEPDTEYTYQLGDEKSAHRFTTRTAPRPDSGPNAKAFRILAFGDSGSGEQVQYDLAKLMQAQAPAIAIHTGDLIYPDGEREDYPAKFFDPYASLIATTPLYPCPGNHDVRTRLAGPMFDEFELPQNGPASATPERHYWFDYGMVRFVSMDTNISLRTMTDEIVPWLDKALSDPSPRWKICYFHHPVYTNANYGPTKKLWNTIVPVMEKRGVQLVLNGHDHLYERSYPIRGQKIVEPGEGVVYITTGAGGAKLYTPKATPIPELATVFESAHSFTIIDVTFDALNVKQINVRGTTVDEFRIPHQASAPAEGDADKKELAPAA
ncbi:MAG TPA: metallophosphoesterase family protein [Phycisphaerae bacterium]|nr:metallophosphoesterase family protein [Phycisphaerae bacterium]HRW53372.1 metallophosphoesterase family protein [Phycisphaerae bacterium]